MQPWAVRTARRPPLQNRSRNHRPRADTTMSFALRKAKLRLGSNSTASSGWRGFEPRLSDSESDFLPVRRPPNLPSWVGQKPKSRAHDRLYCRWQTFKLSMCFGSRCLRIEKFLSSHFADARLVSYHDESRHDKMLLGTTAKSHDYKRTDWHHYMRYHVVTPANATATPAALQNSISS